MDERIEHAEQLLKPVIRELVRTKVLPPQITLLVDKISIVRVASPDDSAPIQAYRLCLTDLEKTIQGNPTQN